MCLADGSEKEEWIEELRKFCTDLRVFHRPKWQDPFRLSKGTIFSPPGASAKYWHPGMGDLIRRTIEEREPDLVEFHHLNTAVYREFAGGLPSILREHNVEYKIWERFAVNAQRWPERSYVRWTAPRVRRYEADVARRFSRCVVVSEADAAHLRRVAPEARIEVIPSGVDTEYFSPDPNAVVEPLSMTLTGSFVWRPRHQSLFILLTKIFAKVKAQLPGAKLYVVGKGVPQYLRQLAREISGVTIVGQVPDVRPYIARSALLINYLESGGGIALKVLEAMAMRKPVLCNSLGCEGIPTSHGKDIFIADGLENFSSAAVYLLENESIRNGIADNAYQIALEKYSWRQVASDFTNCYARILAKYDGGQDRPNIRLESLA